ncbi:MAG: hypothetical protein JWM62_641 [Frankiales bacterium]|nr:hypothetical protein [Frankiales bacterium]
MSSGLLDGDVLSPEEAAQVASLDLVRDALIADARSWAVLLGELAALAARADEAGPQVRRTLALELAGSWQVGQLIAAVDRVRDIQRPRTGRACYAVVTRARSASLGSAGECGSTRTL